MTFSWYIDKPGPPINLTPNDTTKTTTRLTWAPPEDDGGSPVTGYYVERMAAYSTRWSKVNKKAVSDLELFIDDLEEGVEYKIRVCAENAAGVGEPCEPITIVVKDPFGEWEIIIWSSWITFLWMFCLSKRNPIQYTRYINGLFL